MAEQQTNTLAPVLPIYTVELSGLGVHTPDLAEFVTLDQALERAEEHFFDDNVDDGEDAESLLATLKSWVADREHCRTNATISIPNGDGSQVVTVTVKDVDGDDVDERRRALALHINVSLDDVDTAEYGSYSFEADGEEWLVLTAEEAEEACEERIRDELWAFNADFLVRYVPNGITAEHLEKMRGNSCEDINDAFVALVESGGSFSALVEDAISADGMGHFLSHYDGNEVDSQCGRYVMFRTN